MELMVRRLLPLCFFVLLALRFSTVAAAGAGISVDAGLTPAEDRWMFRTQLRYMQRNDDPGPMGREMERKVWNNVLAYGLKRNLTLMVRQQLIDQDMSMAGSSRSDTGLGDLFIAAKYGLYRRNTADYTLGVATTLGLELPTGSAPFSSDTWDLKPGIYLSWRSRAWASDLSVAYMWSDFINETASGATPGNELSLDWALARQFSLGNSAEKALAPVVELSYRNKAPNQMSGHDVMNSGESALFLSPGVKLTLSSLIVEALVQIPVWQEQKGTQNKRDTGFILGMRYMF